MPSALGPTSLQHNTHMNSHTAVHGKCTGPWVLWTHVGACAHRHAHGLCMHGVSSAAGPSRGAGSREQGAGSREQGAGGRWLGRARRVPPRRTGCSLLPAPCPLGYSTNEARGLAVLRGLVRRLAQPVPPLAPATQQGTQVLMPTHVYTCIYACTRTHACMHAHAHTCIHVTRIRTRSPVSTPRAVAWDSNGTPTAVHMHAYTHAHHCIHASLGGSPTTAHLCPHWRRLVLSRPIECQSVRPGNAHNRRVRRCPQQASKQPT